MNWNIVDDQRYNKLRNVFIKHPRMKDLTEFLSKRIERKDEESIYFLTLLFESSDFLSLFLEYDDVRRKCMDAIFNSLTILFTKLDLAKNPHIMLMENLVSIAGIREGRSFLLKDHSRQLLELIAQFISKFDKLYERYKAFTDETPEEGSELQGLSKLFGHFFRFYGSCHDERCHLVQAILDHFNSSRGVAKVLAHVQVFSNLPTLRKNECFDLVDVEHYAKFLAAVKQRGGVEEEAKQSGAIPDALNRSKSTSSTNIKVKLEDFLYTAKSGSAQSNRSNEDGSAAQSSTAIDVPSEEREKGNDKHNDSGNQELIDLDMEQEKTTDAESNSLSHDDETAKASKAQPETDQPMASNSMNGTNDEMDVEKRKERAGLLLASMVASQGPEAASSSKAGPSEPEDKESAEALREKKSAEALLGLFDAVPITQGNVMSDIISASSKKRKEVTMKENSLERLAKRLNSQKENMKLDDPNTAQTSAAMDSPDLLLNSSKEAQIIRTLFSPKEKAKKKDAVWRAYVSNSWEDDEFLFEPLSSPEFIDPAEYESDENSNDLKPQCNVYLGMKNSQSAKSHGETEERRAREPISFEMNASWARNLEAQRSGKPELKSSMSGISTSYPSLSSDMLHQLAKKMRPESPSSSRAEIDGLKASESNFSRSQRTAAEALCGDVSRDELRKKVANYFPVLQQKSGQDRGDGQLPFGASMSMSKSDTNRGGSPKGSGVGDRSSIPSLIDKVGDSSWQDKVAKGKSTSVSARQLKVSDLLFLHQFPRCRAHRCRAPLPRQGQWLCPLLATCYLR